MRHTDRTRTIAGLDGFGFAGEEDAIATLHLASPAAAVQAAIHPAWAMARQGDFTPAYFAENFRVGQVGVVQNRLRSLCAATLRHSESRSRSARYAKSGEHSNDVDLDLCAQRQIEAAHRRPGRRVGRKELGIDLVHRLEVTHGV